MGNLCIMTFEREGRVARILTNGRSYIVDTPEYTTTKESLFKAIAHLSAAGWNVVSDNFDRHAREIRLQNYNKKN